ncbi:stage II sporulation protein M [Desulfuribacillus stibiiarsenatis]|uniref:Stage II sporulation protein M n=1 Tax=Desulfuribacillus stibiiarsenatis TaxID=1390249 RepID=A0A1E5L6T3_9FIRM|nr:stage II sporulation protein M [Desulfuribacillus stibiiarsenatis]OEH85689.1 stage II sporulation protein M [Desulfuribacillus stibiiarsenatis]
MISRIFQSTHRFVSNHILIFIFLLVLFSISILFGTLVVQALQSNQKNELYMYFNSFIKYSHQHQLSTNQILWEALGQNIKFIGLLWILGLSVIGLPFIILVVFVKGFSIGFTTTFLLEQYSYQGMKLALGAILPQNLIMVPVTILVGVSGIVFSIQLIQNRIVQAGEPLFSKFLQYILIMVISIVLVLLASMYEAYLAPYFYKLLEFV